MIRDDYESVTHEACEVCGSSDNKAVYHYPDNSTSWHCFTPGCTNHSSSSKGGFRAVDTGRFSLFSKDLASRGLTVQSLTHYNIMWSKKRGKPEVAFLYYKEEDQPHGMKVRDAEKNFWWEGNAKDPWLFGRWVIPQHRRKYLIITEGEFDAVAAYQMTGYCVVSLPNGASAAVKDIKNNLKWIEEFDKVVLAFDNDEPGREAANAVLEILQAGKAYKATLRYKDACEYTKLGDRGAQEFKEDIDKARCKETTAIYNKEALMNACTIHLNRTDDETNGLSSGFPDIDKWWRIRPEEVTTFFSDPSVGKSSLVRQIAANYIQMYPNKNVLFFPFEESYVRYFMKILDMTLDGDFTKQREMVEPMTDRLFSANVFGYDLKMIAEAIEYAVRGMDVGLVIFDNLTACCAGKSDYQESVRELLALLVSLGKKFKHSTLLVSHTKRDANLKAGVPPLINAAFGSSGVEQFSDNIISLGREEGVDELWFAVRKQRENGLVGVSERPLRYNREKRCFNGIKLDISKQENNGDTRQEETSTKGQITSSNESPRESTTSNSLRRLSERRRSDEQVRQQDGTARPPRSNGIPEGRFASKQNSKPYSSVRRKRYTDAELQPRLRPDPTKWEKIMGRVQRTLEGRGQNEVTELASVFERGDAHYGVFKGYAHYAPSKVDDIFRVGI